jgi:hypothetical protein
MLILYFSTQTKAEENNDKIAAPLEMPLTLEFIETPIGDVGKIIKMKCGVGFRFHDDVYPSIPVTYVASNVKLKVALKRMLSSIRCEYVIKDQSFFIRPAPKK